MKNTFLVLGAILISLGISIPETYAQTQKLKLTNSGIVRKVIEIKNANEKGFLYVLQDDFSASVGTDDHCYTTCITTLVKTRLNGDVLWAKDVPYCTLNGIAENKVSSEIIVAGSGTFDRDQPSHVMVQFLTEDGVVIEQKSITCLPETEGPEPPGGIDLSSQENLCNIRVYDIDGTQSGGYILVGGILEEMVLNVNGVPKLGEKGIVITIKSDHSYHWTKVGPVNTSGNSGSPNVLQNSFFTKVATDDRGHYVYGQGNPSYYIGYSTTPNFGIIHFEEDGTEIWNGDIIRNALALEFEATAGKSILPFNGNRLLHIGQTLFGTEILVQDLDNPYPQFAMIHQLNLDGIFLDEVDLLELETSNTAEFLATGVKVGSDGTEDAVIVAFDEGFSNYTIRYLGFDGVKSDFHTACSLINDFKHSSIAVAEDAGTFMATFHTPTNEPMLIIGSTQNWGNCTYAEVENFNVRNFVHDFYNFSTLKDLATGFVPMDMPVVDVLYGSDDECCTIDADLMDNTYYLCPGENLNIAVNSLGYPFLAVLSNGNLPVVMDDNIVSISQEGDYTLVYTDLAGKCFGTESFTVVSSNVLGVQVDFVCQSDPPVQLTSNIPNGTWSSNEVSVDPLLGVVFPATYTSSPATISYTVAYTSYTGSECVVTESFQLTIGNCRNGVAETQNAIGSSNELLIFPNPANDVLFIQSQNEQQIDVVILYDMMGKISIQSTVGQRNTQLNTADLPAGVYVLSVNQNGQQLKQRIIIE